LSSENLKNLIEKMIKKTIALLLLIAAVYWSFTALMPSGFTKLDTDKNSFSTERALVHLKEISKAPHYVGSKEHDRVRNYIVTQLENLGLHVEIQETFSMRGYGNLSKPKNIITKIKGTNSTKALLLLTHYDSAPQASLGASDAGSGVVTILEGIRAYLSKDEQPKNDIIIVITDAEELGLNGADTFTNKHPWAKDVGLVFNFEARGSGGPSYMLMETNAGNANLMKGFVAANPVYPVANSLAYSIYKMLPNDTDLTVFREDGNIEGFNFAFIDDHYDYHTYMDNFERLDRNTLEHQGSYLMPLLTHFANTDLSNLKTDEDYIYFNVPVLKMVMYPFSWIWPMFVVSLILFIVLLWYGKKNKSITLKEALKGFLPFLGAALISAIVCVLLWRLLKWIYPHYNEMLHGFTYNGYTYISAFVFLTLGLNFLIYHKVNFEKKANALIAPIAIWLVISALAALYLKGASFFVIPVFFALIALFVMIRQESPNLVSMAVLCFPLLLIFAPFIKMFPVGLGLNTLFLVGILGSLMFGLLLPVLSFLKHKKRWANFTLLIAFFSLISAHFNSGFDKDSPKPNSLVYVLDADENKAIWATYDKVLDSWTHNFIGENPEEAKAEQNIFRSKYNSGFSYQSKAPLKHLLEPLVIVLEDTIVGDYRDVSLIVKQQRPVNRFDIFADSLSRFKNFEVNGIAAYKQTKGGYAFEPRRRNRLFTYFVSDNDSLHIKISVPKEQKTKLKLYESSFDLLTNNLFTIPQRTEEMISKPFILNDAVIISKNIDIN
jgi:hypothetical protein